MKLPVVTGLVTAALILSGAILYGILSAKPTTTLSHIQPAERKTAVLGKSTNKSNELIKEINYWKQVIAEHPDYRDGYMQLASLTYKMGNYVAATDYVGKVLSLDPNYEPAIQLKNALSSGN